MAERDPEFVQDVLRVVYAALSDREALAAAMSGQQPMPVPGAAPQQPDPPAPSTPGTAQSPMEVGVQGGANPPIPPLCALRCARTTNVAYEDLGFDANAESWLTQISGQAAGATREEILQEVLRRLLRGGIKDLADIFGIDTSEP